MEIIAILFLLLLFFYISYKLIVFTGSKVLQLAKEHEILTGEVKRESSKISLKIKDWFSWSAQTNNEKGTAGGNIKINFPVKSALALAFICAVIATTGFFTGITAFVIPLIFFSFAVYHFSNWVKSLNILNKQQSENIDSEKKSLSSLRRASEKKYIAGVCQGIHNYLNVSVLLVRALFVALCFCYFIGVIAYIFLWIYLPSDKI